MDCLQEWAPAKAMTRMFSLFKGPTKAAEAFGLTPNRYSVRLKAFLENAMGEKGETDTLNQAWSDAVRTAGAKQRQEQRQGTRQQLQDQPYDKSPDVHGSIRPLSQALTSMEIEIQNKRLVTLVSVSLTRLLIPHHFPFPPTSSHMYLGAIVTAQSHM